MNAEAGTEQKMRKGQERDRSGASALDVHLDGYNVKRIGKSRLSRSIGIALAACILVSSPAQAAKTPLISGTESDSDSEADGPALEDGTITENSADNTIDSQSGSYTEEQLADSVIEYGELEALVRRGNGTAVSADYSYQDSLAVYQEAYNAMISGARDMNYKADELEDAGGDEALIGTYERNAQTLSMAAKQYKKSLTSLNSASSRASRNRTVLQVVRPHRSSGAPAGSFDEVEAGCQDGRELSGAGGSQRAGTGSGALHGDGSAAGSEKPAKRPDSITIYDRSGK